MSDSGGSFGPPRDTPENPSAPSSDSEGLGSLASRSSLGTLDAEIQGALIAGPVFGAEPRTIDRFVIDGILGAGSSGTVYAARDPVLDRRVAIKVLARPDTGGVEAATERLIREARALAQLSHRNVVAIYEVGHWRDRPFMAMELIEGMTLAQWLAAKPRSITEISAVFGEAGQGLAAAHARGRVHRDFKPANVLVANDGRVVVTDFGLVDDAARDPELAEATDAAGGASRDAALRRRPVGTPAYVAPEQRDGAAPRPSADVYSFALALIEAVLGQHPMPESSARWKSALKRRVSRPLYRALCAAMAPDPQHRTRSLDPLLDVLSTHRRGRSRRPAVLIAAAAMAAALMAIAWGRARRAPREPHVPLPAPGLEDARSKPTQALPPRLLPSDLFEAARALLVIPAERRDDRWAERARTLLMLPIPTQVACNWPAPPRTVIFVGDHAVILDLEGRVLSCATGTGAVTTVASNVTCIRPNDDGTMLGVTFRDDKITTYQARGAAWSPIAAPAVIAHMADTGRAPLCRFFVSSQGNVLPVPQADAPAWPQADIASFAGAGRNLVLKADSSLRWQVDDRPPKALVSSHVQRVRFDTALQYGVVVTPARVQILDATTGTMIADATSPSPVDYKSIDISGDGSGAVALRPDGQVLWWRRGDRRWQTRPVPSDSTDVRISPRGDRALIWDGAGRLDVQELASGRRVPLADAQLRMAHFIDDDHVVAADEAGTVWRWSLSHVRSSVLADHGGEGWIWGFATCDRGASVVSATKDGAILVSSPGGAPQLALRKPPGAQIYGITCPRDRILAGTRDGHVLEWEWPTGRALGEHDVGVRAWIWTIASVQPSAGPRIDFVGTGLIGDAEPRAGGRVIALHDGAPAPVFVADASGNTGIDDSAVSSDRKTVAVVASSGQLAMIDVVAGTTGPTVQAHKGEARRVRFSAADRSVVTTGDDGYVRQWRASDLALQSEVNVDHGLNYDLDVRDGIALVGTSEGHVGTWDLAARHQVRTYTGHSAALAAARFDASGRWIASGDFAGRVCVYRADLEACHVELVGHKQGTTIRHVAFLPDGQLITASEDGTVRQWNVPYDASGAQLACELGSHLSDLDPGACASR
jgi:serine/threonine protein kinase